LKIEKGLNIIGFVIVKKITDNNAKQQIHNLTGGIFYAAV